MNDVNKRPTDEFSEMLAGWDKKELIKYGNATYGLGLTAAMNRPDLINAIQQSAKKFALNQTIKVGEHLAEQEVTPGFAEIQIHRTEMTKGMNNVIVGLQGRMASLPIGTRFWCPLELLGVLQDAVRFEYEQDKSVNPPELIEREVHSYPFTVLRIAPHTEASKAQASRARGLRGRAPGAAQRRREAKLAAGAVGL